MNILDIIGQDIALTRRGKNYFGLCPFHMEQTPSLSVSPEKNLYYCFGCGRGGDAISYLMRARGLSFRGAATITGKHLHTPPPPPQSAPTVLYSYLAEQYEIAIEELQMIQWAERSMAKIPELYTAQERMEWAIAAVRVYQLSDVLDQLFDKVKMAIYA